MGDFCRLISCAVVGLFRSRAALQAEILVPRHQLNVLRRKAPKRVAFSAVDRLLFTGLYRLTPGVLDALKVLKPETVIRWHRAGFRAYWRVSLAGPAVPRSWPTMWNEFLPISMPITAISLLNFSDMACSFVFGAPCQLCLLEGREHGRTIPFSDIRRQYLTRPMAIKTHSRTALA
jgi:hypothetical protein